MNRLIFQKGRPEPEEMKAESEKKQKNMISTLEEKKKQLQKQKETIEQLNHELRELDIPVSKEISELRTRIDQVERELYRATKIRKQKEQELLSAIETVSKLADEKSALTERLKCIMYDFETTKQKKLQEIEVKMQGVYDVCKKMIKNIMGVISTNK